jgi:hypothetical protein
VRRLIDLMLAEDLPSYLEIMKLSLVAEFMAALEQVGVVPAQMRVAA